MSAGPFIWFHLIMWHASQVYWIGAFETYEACHDVQVRMEQMQGHADDRFACPSIEVQKT